MCLREETNWRASAYVGFNFRVAIIRAQARKLISKFTTVRWARRSVVCLRENQSVPEILK